MTKLQELEIKLAKAEAKGEVWEQAYRLVVVKGIQVSEEHIKKIKDRKASVENYEEGAKYANHLLELHGIDNEGEEFGVQSGWLVAAANWIREQVVEYAVGLLVELVKKNAVKAVNYLLEQSEEIIIKGLDRLEEADRKLLINDMKQYPRFAELLKKLGEQENQG